MMDCLYAKCIPCITDCVLGELEKLGEKYRIALKMAKDERFTRLPCSHKGTYADDCLVQRVTQHKCYIIATCDKELKQRIRKIPVNRFYTDLNGQVQRCPGMYTYLNFKTIPRLTKHTGCSDNDDTVS